MSGIELFPIFSAHSLMTSIGTWRAGLRRIRLYRRMYAGETFNLISHYDIM